MKLNKINEVLNSAKWIFGLLSSRNFATMATWSKVCTQRGRCWRNPFDYLNFQVERKIQKWILSLDIRWIGFGVCSERVGGGGALRTSSPYPTKTILQDNQYVTSQQPYWWSRTEAFLPSGNWTLFSCKFFAKKFSCYYPQYCRLVTWLQTKNTRDDHLKRVVPSLCLK